MFPKTSRWLLTTMMPVVVAMLAACGTAAATGSKLEVTGAWVRSASMAAGTEASMGTQEAGGMSMGGTGTPAAGDMLTGSMGTPTQAAGSTAMGNMGTMDMGPATSAAYMVIKNSGSEPDALMSAKSDVAKAVELHNVKMDNDVMTMFQVPQIAIPANGQVELKSGSYHIMLIGLTQDLKAGDKVTLTLSFEKNGSMTVEAEVRDQ